MTQKLEGGYINDVTTDGNVVRKVFTGEDKLSIPNHIRQAREHAGLARFGGDLAPKLVDEGEDFLLQELIAGINAEKIVEQYDLKEAGKLLRRIHQAVARPFDYTKQQIEKRVEKMFAKARPILDKEQVPVSVDIDWNIVEMAGTTRVHRDFWLGNIIANNGSSRVIDWEVSGIGSPYEDFAVADLWIFQEYGIDPAEFYQAYGVRPDQKTIDEFVKLKCIDALATTQLDEYLVEPEDGFYHNKIKSLKRYI